MKFFGKSRTAILVEEYHPWVSVVALIGIGLMKYYHPEKFEAITDISYPSVMDRGTEKVEHYRKGANDTLFVFFILNAVTVARYLYRKLVLEVQLFFSCGVVLFLIFFSLQSHLQDILSFQKASHTNSLMQVGFLCITWWPLFGDMSFLEMYVSREKSNVKKCKKRQQLLE